MLRVLISLVIISSADCSTAQELFKGESFTGHDSVLVVDHNDRVLFDWQSRKPLIPASLTKLATAHLAINKWGLENRFITEFYTHEGNVWVKGYGDPFLISEELDLIVEQLHGAGLQQPEAIYVDSSYFDFDAVPGRTKVADPYNAPLAAVSANFNTAMLRRKNSEVVSAEAQTPLTPTAKKMASSLSTKVERVNLVTSNNAQRNFAELLQLKAGWPKTPIYINQLMPERAKLVYRHQSSRTLAQVLQGALEFSNNFIANQVFLKLTDKPELTSVSFKKAKLGAVAALSRQFEWRDFNVEEGSGLSRANRFSARQLDDLLRELRPNKNLLKQYKVKGFKALVHAKTGTLNGVHSYAGYIEFSNRHYRFVFNFNRPVPYRYRNQLLEKLLASLANA